MWGRLDPRPSRDSWVLSYMAVRMKAVGHSMATVYGYNSAEPESVNGHLCKLQTPEAGHLLAPCRACSELVNNSCCCQARALPLLAFQSLKNNLHR